MFQAIFIVFMFVQQSTARLAATSGAGLATTTTATRLSVSLVVGRNPLHRPLVLTHQVIVLIGQGVVPRATL